MIIKKTALGLQADLSSLTNEERIVAIHDDVLLSQIRADDALAFHHLIERYLNKIWKLSIRILGDQDEAEDIVQDVFMTIWQNRDQWDSESDGGTAKFSTWIYRVAFNKCIDFKRRRKDTVDIEDEPLEADIASGDEIIEQSQLALTMLDLVAQLPEAQQQVLTALYYEELSIAQICTRMDKTDEAVRSLLKRGKQNLRELIEARPDLAHLSAFI